MMTRLVTTLFTILFMSLISRAHASTNTAAIVANTLSAAPRCLDYKVNGVCIWLKCSALPPRCRAVTNLRVSHFTPEVVVSTWHEAAAHPWGDYGRQVALASKTAAGTVVGSTIDSAGSNFSADRTNRNAIFRDADAIGNPTASISTGLICPPTSRPLLPHFQSYLDGLVWRGIAPVELQYPGSLVPGLYEIGSFPTNTWGSLYPRVGGVVQPNPMKASAVLAQRVANIISQSGQPHVYQPLSTPASHKYFGGAAVMPNDPSKSKWQRLYPNASSRCEVFGTNDSLGLSSWGDGNGTAEESYSWNLWRRLECCKAEGSFVATVVF